MLYREIIAVCSDIHTKHLNTLCGKDVGPLSLVSLMRSIEELLEYK